MCRAPVLLQGKRAIYHDPRRFVEHSCQNKLMQMALGGRDGNVNCQQAADPEFGASSQCLASQTMLLLVI
jgi:hypothetical protein